MELLSHIYLLQSTDDCRFGNYYYAVLLHIRKYQQCTNDMVIQIKGIFIAILIVIVSMVIISFTPVEYISPIFICSLLLAFLIYPTLYAKKMKHRYMNFPHLVESNAMDHGF